jgi:uncharacterized protein (TIGR01777 family)
MSRKLLFRSEMPVPAKVLFDWHTRPGAFERLQPPWAPAGVVARKGTIRDGDVTVARIPMGLLPLTTRWVARHFDYVEGEQFSDEMVEGPFRQWRHVHRVERIDDARSALVDDIEYDLPLRPFSSIGEGTLVRAQLERTFAYRHAVLREDLRLHASLALAPKRVLMTGATGLVGSQLAALLTTGGHEVIRLARAPETDRPGQIAWDPRKGFEPGDPRLEGIDVVIHLAGENVGAGRWTDARKARIRDSRIGPTRLLAEAIARMERKPEAFLCASAVGWYGNRGDAVLGESEPAADTFLGRTCAEWEAAAEPARAAGIRTVHLRLGVVLSPQGGALAKMLPPFLAGVGGPFGDGRQWLPWITIDDVVGAFLFAMGTPSLEGAVNLCQEPVRVAEFAETLGRVLSRPSFMPAPAAALRLAFGEMADALLLASVRAVPTRLREAGYRFRHATVEDGLRHLLGHAGWSNANGP